MSDFAATRFITLLFLGLLAAPLSAAELVPYLDAAPHDRPRSSLGVDFKTRNLRFRTDFTAKSDGGRTQVLPKLQSNFKLTPKLRIETRIDLPDWNARSAAPNANVETRLQFRPALPVVDEIEAQIGKTPHGHTRRLFRFAMSERLDRADPTRRVTFRASATMEQVELVELTSAVLGIEATLAGFAPGRFRVDNRLHLRYRERSHTDRSSVGTLAYQRIWPLGRRARVGLDCEYVGTDEPNRRVKLSWEGRF